jgi:hypothetical protein
MTLQTCGASLCIRAKSIIISSNPKLTVSFSHELMIFRRNDEQSLRPLQRVEYAVVHILDAGVASCGNRRQCTMQEDPVTTGRDRLSVDHPI